MLRPPLLPETSRLGLRRVLTASGLGLGCLKLSEPPSQGAPNDAQHSQQNSFWNKPECTSESPQGFFLDSHSPSQLHPTGNSTLGATLVPFTEMCNASFEDNRVVPVTVYSVVCILGFPANCLTAWLTLLQVLQGHVLAVYLFFLALCELLYISTLPLWILYIQNKHQWTLGLKACQVTAYIFFCNIYISILLLCCISCDRFMAVVYALESRGHRHQRTAIIISLCTFILVGLVYYPVFDIKTENTCFEPLRIDSKITSYHYLRFVFGFAIPLGIITFTNHRIFRSIKLSTSLSTAQKTKVKHAAMAVVVIFLVCFAPYHVVLLVKAAIFSFYQGNKEAVCPFVGRLYTPSIVFLCLSTVNSVADPIIYVLATDHSRQEASRIHTRWKKWSTKTDVTYLKDSEETRSPTPLANNYSSPKSVHLPGLQSDELRLPCTPESLPEEFC